MRARVALLVAVLFAAVVANVRLTLPAHAANWETTAGGIGAIVASSSGPTDIATSGTSSTITLGNSRTILTMDRFNLAPGYTLNFVFASATDIVLIRVPSGSAATIDGALRARMGSTGGQPGGNVWIATPGGVVFGQHSITDVGGLLATPATIGDTDFFSGNYRFGGVHAAKT